MNSTIVSWGLFISLVGAVIYVYRPDLWNKIVSQGQQETAPVPSEPTIKAPNKKQKAKKIVAAKLAGDEKAGSASDSQSNKKRKIATTPAETTSATSTQAEKQQSPPQVESAGLSDKDFAKQLAQTQSGTKLQVPSKHQPSKKDRRATKLTAVGSPDPSGFSTEASSTTGRDADDDLTPADSPSPEEQPIEGPTGGAISKAGDITDMLEAPAAKPTTLRLTDIPTENKTKKATNKAFEPVLSKKKRYEQQRKEEQKLAREESERMHDAKKQEQLRKARMAAGTSNQTKATNFAAKANAWQSGTSSAVKTAPANQDQSLLDTFDPNASTAGPAHGAVHTETTEADSAHTLKSRVGEDTAAAMTASASREGLPAAERKQHTSEISEEDQMRMLEEQEREVAWESVSNKKSKRKGKQDNESNSGASSPVRAAPVSVKAQVNGNKSNGASKKTDGVNRFQSFQNNVESGLQDAEWEA